jgi:hypothetical protein
LRLYLETTLFNYYFDADRDGHTDTVKLFKAVSVGEYEAYTSNYTVTELKDAPEPKQSNMLKLIEKYGIVMLNADDESDRLADRYISEGVISPNHRYDPHSAVEFCSFLFFDLSLKYIKKPLYALAILL